LAAETLGDVADEEGTIDAPHEPAEERAKVLVEDALLSFQCFRGEVVLLTGPVQGQFVSTKIH
jgi:hypothetical protein